MNRRRWSTLAWATAITLGQGVLFQGAAWAQSVLLSDSPDRTLALAKILGAVLAEGAMIGALMVAFRRSGVPFFERPLREPGRARAWIMAGGSGSSSLCPCSSHPRPRHLCWS